jgi:hypothetical protein
MDFLQNMATVGKGSLKYNIIYSYSTNLLTPVINKYENKERYDIDHNNPYSWYSFKIKHWKSGNLTDIIEELNSNWTNYSRVGGNALLFHFYDDEYMYDYLKANQQFKSLFKLQENIKSFEEIYKLNEQMRREDKIWYHGSTKDFDKLEAKSEYHHNISDFDDMKAIFLSPNKNFAYKYISNHGYSPTNVVYTCKLIRPVNLFNVASKKDMNKVSKFLDEKDIKDLEELTTDDLLKKYPRYFRHIEKPKIIKAIRAAGFDGFCCSEEDMENIGIFDSSLIKIIDKASSFDELDKLLKPKEIKFKFELLKNRMPIWPLEKIPPLFDKLGLELEERIIDNYFISGINDYAIRNDSSKLNTFSQWIIGDNKHLDAEQLVRRVHRLFIMSTEPAR